MKAKILYFLILMVMLAGAARAQGIVPRGMPLSMTLTLKKPAPDETFGNQRLIELGIEQQTYRFILLDFFVADPSGKYNSDDIWRQVEQFKPNFLVQGKDRETVAKIKPGETVTLDGIYAPITRTFEVAEVRPGPGITAPPKSY